jgi:hypothetical protein
MSGAPGASRRRTVALAALLVASLLPAAGFLLHLAGESAVVDGYLRERGLAGLPVTKETAVRVSQAVRADFEIDQTKWKRLDYTKNPFLRHDTGWLLGAREGLCGEGARVIVVLLGRLGFDATRVTLYDAHLQGVHTLVSVKLDGREIFVDSINSPGDFNDLLNTRDVSAADFAVVRYSGDILERHAAGAAIAARDTSGTDPVRARFLDHYRAYSYEAVPVSKLAHAAGLDWRVFNFARPARWVSALAESPRAILTLFWLALGLALDAAVLTALRARSRRAART